MDPSFTGPSVSNTATVASTGTSDPAAGNNTDTETTAVVVSADLSITKDDAETTVTAGDGATYTYTIVVTNGGPSTATGVSLSDAWPAGFTRGTVTAPAGVTCDTHDQHDRLLLHHRNPRARRLGNGHRDLHGRLDRQRWTADELRRGEWGRRRR